MARLKLQIAFGIAAITVAGGAFAQAQVYRYTDTDGHVVYTDRPPSGEVKNLQTKKMGSNFISTSEPSYAAALAAEHFPVTLYTFACGEVCQNAESLLNKRGVPFTVVNVSEPEGQARLQAINNEGVAPVLTVGDKLTAKGFNEARWQAMLDGMKAGDYLFVEFGINDGDSTCNRHVGTGLFQTYLETMAGAAKTRGAQAIFLTSTSAIACSGSTAQANRGFGPQTKAAGTAASVPVIDLTVLSAAFYTSLGLCPNASDYTSTTSVVGKFFCDDHTHFEAAGATQIAGVVAKALRDQGIGLAAYLK